MDKIIKAFLISSLLALTFSAGYWTKSAVSEKERSLEKEALNDCIEEVSSKCSMSISYAIALEKENSILNKLLKMCKERLEN